MKLTQKQFFIAGLCLIALVVIAANPSFTDFIASQFDTSGNVVKIKSGVVLTNVSEWGPMTVSDSITASNGFFSLGTAAGELVLGQGSGTGGIFDYSGATKSNEVVVVNAAGRFVSIPGTAFTNGSPQVWANSGGFIFPVVTNAVVLTPDVGGTLHLGVNTFTNYTPLPGDFNIALGDEALSSLQSGSDNIALGRQAMLVQTNASSDVAIGVNALGFPIVSANNVAVGNQAGGAGSSVFQLNNVWIGSSAGNSNGTTNNDCVAVGFESLFNVVNVDGLTAIGYHSLLNDSTGATNTAVGFMSGAKITTGSSNTFLGYQADAASAGLNNATAIGALAVVSTSDTIQLGNSAVTSVNTPAVVTAAGFTDSSGTPGSLVAYQGGNRLGATNSISGLAGQVWTNPPGLIKQVDNGVTNYTLLYSNTLSSIFTATEGVIVDAGSAVQSTYRASSTITGGTNLLSAFSVEAFGPSQNSSVVLSANNDDQGLVNNDRASIALQPGNGLQINIVGADSASPSTGIHYNSGAFDVSGVGIVSAAGYTNTAFAANGVVTNDSLGGFHTTPTLPSGLLPANIVFTDVAQTISSTKAFTASNYIAGAQGVYTNSNNTTPDFNVLSSTLSTNANFTWLAPTHIDTSGKVEQWIITHVTNSSGSLITMTAPANVHVCGGGANNVTNWTEVRWQYVPPSGPTNYWPSPGY